MGLSNRPRGIIKRTERWLDFDIECRPLSWYGGDWVTKEITAIAAAWIGPNGKSKGPVSAWLLDPFGFMANADYDPTNPVSIGDAFESAMRASTLEMLEGFRAMYDAADIVTGHYIRGFDLPLLNGAALEFGISTFGDKLSCDTKGDLVRSQGLSKSMENLGAVFELNHPKVQMNQATWRAANRLLPRGLALTRKRVVGDVREHIEMLKVMLDRGVLRAPSIWSGAGNGATPQYQA